MRTGVVDGVELTVHVEQGDLLSLHFDQIAVVRLKLARLRYFDIFAGWRPEGSGRFPEGTCGS